MTNIMSERGTGNLILDWIERTSPADRHALLQRINDRIDALDQSAPGKTPHHVDREGTAAIALFLEYADWLGVTPAELYRLVGDMQDQTVSAVVPYRVHCMLEEARNPHEETASSSATST